MTPEEIVAKFAHSFDNFEPIDRQPSDTDLTRLREAVAPLLLQILYDETGPGHNLIGLIRPEAAYVARYGEALPEPTIIGTYNATIDDDTTTIVRARSEAAHKKKRADCATYETARRETTHFVLAVIANTWVGNFGTATRYIPRSRLKTSLYTSKRGAPAGTPSTSWCCITKCSATTSSSRDSPSHWITLS